VDDSGDDGPGEDHGRLSKMSAIQQFVDRHKQEPHSGMLSQSQSPFEGRSPVLSQGQGVVGSSLAHALGQA